SLPSRISRPCSAHVRPRRPVHAPSCSGPRASRVAETRHSMSCTSPFCASIGNYITEKGGMTRAILLSARCKCLSSNHAHCQSSVIFIPVTELIRIKIGVEAAQREQLLVLAALDYAPVFEREDDVGLDDRFQVVGDDYDGLARGQASERFEH